jgi:hypothetical protein
MALSFRFSIPTYLDMDNPLVDMAAIMACVIVVDRLIECQLCRIRAVKVEEY